jgi:dihydroorotase
VLIDPEERWIPAEAPLKSKARNTPFLHQELTGRVLLTLAGGQLVFDRTEARS